MICLKFDLDETNVLNLHSPLALYYGPCIVLGRYLSIFRSLVNTILATYTRYILIDMLMTDFPHKTNRHWNPPTVDLYLTTRLIGSTIVEF